MTTQASSPASNIPEPSSPVPPWLRIVRERVGGLRFGTVQIVIHEGRVTQVESTERTRLANAESASV